MTSFINKKIKSQRILATILHEAREARGISLEMIASSIQISSRWLIALESGNYGALPGKIYEENWLAKYAGFLGLDVNEVLQKYRQEEGAFRRRQQSFSILKISSKPKKSVFGQIKILVIVLTLIGLSGYLSWELKKVLMPPVLSVNQPSENLVLRDRDLMITGQTFGGTSVSINDQIVLLDNDGCFQQQVSLQSGLNIIKIESAKKYSKSRIIQRKVTVLEY